MCGFHDSHFQGRIKNQFQRVSAAALLFLILQFHQYLLCKKVSNAWKIDFLRKIHFIFRSLNLRFCRLSQFFSSSVLTFLFCPSHFFSALILQFQRGLHLARDSGTPPGGPITLLHPIYNWLSIYENFIKLLVIHHIIQYNI